MLLHVKTCRNSSNPVGIRSFASRILLATLLLTCLSVSCPFARGQAAPPPPPQTSTEAPTPQENSTSSTPEAFRPSQALQDKAVSLARKEYPLYFIAVAWNFLLLIALLRWGLIARLRDLAERASSRLLVQALVFIPALVLLLALLRFPVAIAYHWLAVHYGLSVQAWGSWLWDWTKGRALFVALAYVVGIILVGVLRWKPRSWWFYLWSALAPLGIFLIFLAPWLLDPIFNTFEPLSKTQPQLAASIATLSDRAGVPIPAERMFLMKASAKSNEVNAYVTGFGASKRVVVWDTTIQKMPADEVLFIAGHELGHYVLGHVWKGLLLFVVGLFFGCYLLQLLFGWILRRWGSAWDVRRRYDWVAVTALLLLFYAMDFLSEPLDNAISRAIEHQADVYALEITHGLLPHPKEVAARSFLRLGEIDLADPDPPAFITFWLYSHPPIADRVKFAREYDPWSQGQPPQYVP